MQTAPPAIETIAHRELAGERVLWSAVPERWRYAWRVGGIAIVPLVLLVAFVAISIGFYLLTPSNSGQAERTLFAIPGMPFVPFVVLLALVPLLSAWEAGRTFYAVTDKRAVIFRKNWKLHLHSYPAAQFDGYERESNGNSQGSIVFQRWAEPGARGKRDVKEIGFLAIADVAGAERALEEMLGRHRRA